MISGTTECLLWGRSARWCSLGSTLSTGSGSPLTVTAQRCTEFVRLCRFNIVDNKSTIQMFMTTFCQISKTKFYERCCWQLTLQRGCWAPLFFRLLNSSWVQYLFVWLHQDIQQSSNRGEQSTQKRNQVYQLPVDIDRKANLALECSKMYSS